jgi:hypothetical protein
MSGGKFMDFHTTGCLVCGKNLRYFQLARRLKCELCGLEFDSAAACEDGHFVCDQCHARAGLESITSLALETGSRNPVAIANKMMKSPFVNMHGPEHHYLVVAALLAVYKNSGGQVDLPTALTEARQRAEKVPGGICGHWGCCGAAIGSGIFVSLITGATPMSVDEWRLANSMTALSLEAIARNGGPRCCKRDAYLAIMTAAGFVREHFGIDMEVSELIICPFYKANASCRKRACPFYNQEGC